MIRVIFVDDDMNLLQGLRRGLRRKIGEWDMEFLDNPLLAMQLMEVKDYDVLVSDLQMPGMTGLELIKQTSDLYPNIVPIILSGQVDRVLMMHSVRINAHVLLKPCKVEELILTIERAYSLKALLKSERVKNVVDRLSELPSLSQTHTQLLSLLENDVASISQITKLIQQDVSIAAKVMQLANSAFFGYNKISRLEGAIKILGLTHIRLLVLASDIFLKIDAANDIANDIDISSVIRHSMNVGRLASQIARSLKLSLDDCESAHVAGLLHDIGQLVLLNDMSSEMLQVVELAFRTGKKVNVAEIDIFGCNHAEVGAYLLGMWMLPNSILETVAFHHNPFVLPIRPSVISAVFLADALEHSLFGSFFVEVDNDMYNEYVKRLDVGELIEFWKIEAEEKFKNKIVV